MGRGLSVTQRWQCVNCRLEDVTRGAFLPNRFHTCPRMHGITAPMVPAGTSAKVEAHLREDHVGTERVTTDDEGRPVMAVITTRDDGQDVAVFAPVATTFANPTER